MIILGLLLLFTGSYLLRGAYLADLHHSVLPGGGVRSAWMSPFQGYVAAGLCIAVGLYAVIAPLRNFRRK
jgi:hypothetical protein